MEKRLKILFTTAWYPNRYDAMEGLFVRKHAEAVSRFADVCVLYFHPNYTEKKTEICVENYNGIKEITIYHTNKISQIVAFRKSIKLIFKTFGKPDLTHANVLSKAAFIGYYLKKHYKIPYVVTEHWTGFLPQNGNFASRNFVFKKIVRIAAKRTEFLLPVSQCLAKAMVENGVKNSKTQIVNNVVDDFFYHTPPEIENRTKKRILHISCFNEKAKNVKGILRAIKQLSAQRNDFELIIIGTGADYNDVFDYAKTLNLPNKLVQFIGEKTPEKVCKWLYNSDFLLMFSNYETAGVIFSEAWACGKPIVTTPVGIIPEFADKNIGAISPIGDEEKLAKNINWMLDNFQSFNAELLKTEGRKFSSENVGAQLKRIYLSALS